MDETKMLLGAIMDRLEELSAQVKGLQVGISNIETRLDRREAEVKDLRTDTNVRLNKIDSRLDYLFVKWGEHDEEIMRLQRRQA